MRGSHLIEFRGRFHILERETILMLSLVKRIEEGKYSTRLTYKVERGELKILIGGKLKRV